MGRKANHYSLRNRGFYIGAHHEEALRRYAFKHRHANPSDALRAVLDQVAVLVGVAVPKSEAAGAAR